jgi:hypothetical protein
VYGDADPSLTYQITGGSLAFSDVFSGALARISGENVGSYAIGQGTLSAGSNYMLTFIGANFSITVRPITVTAAAKTKIYGDPDPALTYQITSGSLAFSDIFSGTLTRAAGETVGTYAISQGTLALTNNYALTFVGANFTITARPITVTANPQAKVYGYADPSFTFHISSGTLVGSDAFSGALSRVSGENVSDYAITQGTLALNANYALTFVSANLSITPRPIGITADPQTKIYGDNDPVFTYHISSGTLVGNDTFSGALSRASGENIGSYLINPGSLTLGTNYTLSLTAANLTITPRPISVMAHQQRILSYRRRLYRQPDPHGWRKHRNVQHQSRNAGAKHELHAFICQRPSDDQRSPCHRDGRRPDQSVWKPGSRADVSPEQRLAGV